METSVVYGNCKECGGLLASHHGRMKCIFCGKKYELKEITTVED